MHQLIIDNIELVLLVIIVAQAIIFYGQSSILKYCKEQFDIIGTYKLITNTTIAALVEKALKGEEK